ncbi:MAG: hypothetical protein SWE60_16710 [Thermodesulfobacteriota bacterium]|nr:hypothetical protein [Thermodesulfobacteriota bacterium]
MEPIEIPWLGSLKGRHVLATGPLVGPNCSKRGMMLKNQVKKEVKKELESMGERLGKRIGTALSGQAENKASELGKKAGKTMARQVERATRALENEEVTKEEQLGIGGKIGTGLGIMAKQAVERRYGLLGKIAGSEALISEGRATGAKAEKMLKRAVKDGVRRVVRRRKGVRDDSQAEGP